MISVCFGSFRHSISECIVEENMFMIVSPKDVVVALLRDHDDHITWLIEHYKFEVGMMHVDLCVMYVDLL